MTPTERRGMWFGLLGVMTFAVTLPVTRLAVGTPEDPHLSGVFVAMGRAAVAGFLSIFYLWFTGALRPNRSQMKGLGLVAVGVVFGFPLFTSLAMRHVEASHASVITGVLPLATAALAAVMNRQRPSWGFWLCAITGTSLVVSFALLRSGQAGLTLQLADLLLLCAMAFAAVGYAWGSRMSQSMGAEQVICWALVISMPVTVPLAWWSQPNTTVPWTAWAGFAYVCLFSMWLGFFAWYRGLAMGGTVRVSQIQLLQPFLGMLIAIPVLGERLDALTVGFGLAVVATVFISRKMAVHRS
jgi:drug/metabolite transporter (DMT)-like permease